MKIVIVDMYGSSIDTKSRNRFFNSVKDAHRFVEAHSEEFVDKTLYALRIEATIKVSAPTTTTTPFREEGVEDEPE